MTNDSRKRRAPPPKQQRNLRSCSSGSFACDSAAKPPAGDAMSLHEMETVVVSGNVDAVAAAAPLPLAAIDPASPLPLAAMVAASPLVAASAPIADAPPVVADAPPAVVADASPAVAADASPAVAADAPPAVAADAPPAAAAVAVVDPGAAAADDAADPAPATPITAFEAPDAPIEDIWREVTRLVCYEMGLDFHHGDGLHEFKAPPSEPPRIHIPDDEQEQLLLIYKKNAALKKERFNSKLTIYTLYTQLLELERGQMQAAEDRTELQRMKVHAGQLQEELHSTVELLAAARAENEALKAARAESVKAAEAEPDRETSSKTEQLQKEIDILKEQLKEKERVIGLLRNVYKAPPKRPPFLTP